MMELRRALSQLSVKYCSRLRARVFAKTQGLIPLVCSPHFVQHQQDPPSIDRVPLLRVDPAYLFLVVDLISAKILLLKILLPAG